MIISDFRVHPVAIADPPFRSSYGLHAPYALRTILELRTTDGLTGISETYGGDQQLSIFESLRPRVLGMDPFALTSLWRDLTSSETGAGERSQTYLVPGENPADRGARAFAAIEIACLDLIGKARRQAAVRCGRRSRARRCPVLGLPVLQARRWWRDWATISGKTNTVKGLTPRPWSRRRARWSDSYGFREIKLKGGVLDPDQEIATIRALYASSVRPIRSASIQTARGALRHSVRVGLALKRGAGRRRLPRRSDGRHGRNGGSPPSVACRGHRHSAGEQRRSHLLRARAASMARDAVQIVLSDPHYWGGIRKQQQLSLFCEVLGMGLSMHSNNHLGVSMMIMAHAAAASPHLTHACDTHYPGKPNTTKSWREAASQLSTAWFAFPTNPDSASNSITIRSPAALRRYRSLPYRKRDDEAEMRKHVDANWTRILPRW